MKRLTLMLALLMALLGGCAREAEPESPASSAATPSRYALVVKDTTNPYMQYMYEGFENACREIGAEAMLAGPDNSDAQAQAAAVDQLVARGVDALAIAVNSPDALAPALERAMEAGVKLLSVDSAAKPEDRLLHIQQASPEVIGRVLIQAACEMLGGSGQLAILSTTRDMPNQALWVSWMRRELSEHAEKYAGLELVDIAYGRDEYAASAEAVGRLLDRYPELDIVIAPTVVGIRAAADTVRARGAGVLVTGLGLPGDMAEYIRSGLCPWMYLWNPIDVGYIAAWACDALSSGAASGQSGETVSAGSFGEKLIEPASDGGTEIVVGNPFQFDSSNIAIWEALF